MASDWRIVIVNYRTPELARQAVRSAHTAAPGASIVVVDSDPAEGFEDLIRTDGAAEVLSLSENRGYGAALNAGLRDATAPYFLVMNADVRVAPSVTRLLQGRFEGFPRLGVVAPRLLSPDGTVQPSCRRFPTHRSLLWSRGSPLRFLRGHADRSYRLPEPSAFTLTDVVAGACMAVRRDAWTELGGMDERFFLYAEDTDFCFRAKRAGWLVGYDPSVTVTHEWGASTSQARRQSHRIHAESLSFYFRKHHPGSRLANAVVSCVLRCHARLRF